MSHGPWPAGGVGEDDGDAEAEAEAEAEGEDVLLGVGVGVPPPPMVPVQVVPLSVNVVGVGFEPFHAPLKPKLVLLPAPMEPLYETLLTVTLPPDWVWLPFQSWVMVCPAPNDQVSV